MVKVVLKDVFKKFGEVTAVDHVDLEINDKEFFVLLGPSGGGKSTILNLIAGLERETSGEIYFDDLLVNKMPPEKRDVAMVFQSYALYPHMNVFDNIAFGLKVRKMLRDEINKRVEYAAGMLRIKDLLKRKPHELSGGQRQRVALARAIVRKPKVFLLDEPMSNVDAKLRVPMRTELIRLQKSLGTTAVYVTHDQVEAMTMADRVAIIDLGKVQQVGSPLETYLKPLSIFVGGFIGTPPMNFFDCSLKMNDGEGRLETAMFSLPIGADVVRTLKERATGSELALGVRPEDISVYRERPFESIEVEVYALEPLGKEIVVDLKLGDEIVKAVTDPTFPGRMGDKVWMTINKERMHVFDRKTEKCVL